MPLIGLIITLPFLVWIRRAVCFEGRLYFSLTLYPSFIKSVPDYIKNLYHKQSQALCNPILYCMCVCFMYSYLVPTQIIMSGSDETEKNNGNWIVAVIVDVVVSCVAFFYLFQAFLHTKSGFYIFKIHLLVVLLFGKCFQCIQLIECDTMG